MYTQTVCGVYVKTVKVSICDFRERGRETERGTQNLFQMSKTRSNLSQGQFHRPLVQVWTCESAIQHSTISQVHEK